MSVQQTTGTEHYSIPAQIVKLRKEYWYKTIWAKFAGNIQRINEAGEERFLPSGMPIETLTDLQQKQGDSIKVPLMKDLTAPGVMGDTKAVGTGEENDFLWLTVFLNQIRKVHRPQVGEMADQRVKEYTAMKQSRPQLRRWFTKDRNQAIYEAFYEGADMYLTGSVNEDGIGLYKRYHPNFYYADTGDVVSAVGTEYSNKQVAELDTAVGNAQALTANLLFDWEGKMHDLQIQPVEYDDGDEYYPLIISHKQHAALMQDSVFRQASERAEMGTGGNPEIRGYARKFAGFMIYRDKVGIRGWDDTNHNFFGDTYKDRISPTKIASNHCALTFGKSAIARANVDKLKMRTNWEDFQNIKEVAGIMKEGYNRNDFAGDDDVEAGFFNRGGTGDNVEASKELHNQSSAILMTSV